MIYTPDQRTVFHYSNGACGLLAYALWFVNKQQGTIGLLHNQEGVPHHACYVLGGYWIDIDGPATRREKMGYWSSSFETIDPEEFARDYIDGPKFKGTRRSLPSAKRFAKRRLSYFLPR